MKLSTTCTQFKPGDITYKIWSGDIVTTCVFVHALTGGGLLFWDATFKCFRRAFWEERDGKFVLNGWDCSDSVFKE